MLILERPYCGIKAKETELTSGFEARGKQFGLGALRDVSGMSYSHQSASVDESVAAGVAH